MKKLIVLLLLSVPYFVDAQTWHLYSAETTGKNTLSCPYATKVLQNQDGNYLILSNYELSEFDGSAWKWLSYNTYNINDYVVKDDTLWCILNGFPAYVVGTDTVINDTLVKYSYFTRVVLDKNQRPWFMSPKKYSYNYGVATFDGKNWIEYDSSVVPLSGLRCMAFDKNNNLYLGTNGGYITYNGVGWTVINRSLNDNLPSDTINSIAFDQDGQVWFGTAKGVYRLDGTNFVTYTASNGLLDDNVHYIYSDDNGKMWIATYQGLAIYDGGNWAYLTQADDLPHNYVYNIYKDDKGTYWISTAKGIAKYDGSKVTEVISSYDGGLPDNDIYDMEFDDNGNLYIATFRGGVAKLGNGRFTYLDGVGSQYFWSFIKDKNGNFWFQSAADSVIYKYDGNSFEPYKVDGRFDESGYCDSKGNLWFGSWQEGAVLKYDGTNWTKLTDPLIEDNVMSISEGPDGDIYMLTYYGTKLVKYNGSGFSLVMDTLIAGTELFLDKDKNFWIFDINRIIKFNGTDYEIYYNTDFRPVEFSIYVNDVEQDEAGNIWMGNAASLLKYDGTNWTIYDKDNGFAANGDVFALALDKTGFPAASSSHQGLFYKENALAVPDLTTKFVTSVYPNPVSDKVNIKAYDATILRVELTDITGKLVMRKDYHSGFVAVETAGLEKGTYILTIYTDKGIAHQKIIK